MHVPNAYYPLAPILCALVLKPMRPPTDTEEATAQAYTYSIVEEQAESDDEAKY